MSREGVEAADLALIEILERLNDGGYAFVSPTPATHRLVRRRRPAMQDDFLRDVLGWGRPFERHEAPSWLMKRMIAADMLKLGPAGCTSKFRVSSLDGRLHLHSASPQEEDAVFLGPDSYRYVRFLKHCLGDASYAQALEIGIGAGAGALSLAAWRPGALVTATDINPQALRLARLNALHARLELDLRHGTLPPGDHLYDLIAANPPYMAGRGGRLYRDGGDQHGAQAALDWAEAALPRLQVGGRLLLYTGAPIVAGADLVRAGLEQLADRHGTGLTYDEIDPDVFGASLERPDYQAVERIAVIGAVMTRQ